MERMRADRAGPCGGEVLPGHPRSGEPFQGEERKVGRPLPRLLSPGEKPASPGKRPKEVGHLLPDLVAAAAGGRPRDRDESESRSGAEPHAQPVNGLLEDPGGKSPPAGVDGGA